MNIKLNQKGITLVELLATLVILTIISILLFSIINNGNSQFTDQSKTNKGLSEISYALKIMTKDIRQYGNVSTEGDNTLYIDNYVYKVINSSLVKIDGNTKKIIETFDNINSFYVNIDKDNFVNIEIKYHDESPVSTKIYIRE